MTARAKLKIKLIKSLTNRKKSLNLCAEYKEGQTPLGGPSEVTLSSSNFFYKNFGKINMQNEGRNWTPIKEVNLIDCAVEYKKMQNLYLDADFDDKMDLALFYKGKAKYYKDLVNAGIEHTVNF